MGVEFLTPEFDDPMQICHKGCLNAGCLEHSKWARGEAVANNEHKSVDGTTEELYGMSE